jgi:hypothetical protein
MLATNGSRYKKLFRLGISALFSLSLDFFLIIIITRNFVLGGQAA